MPRIRMPDGSVLEAPDELQGDDLKAWVKERVRKRTQPNPGPHPGIGSMPFPRDMDEAKDMIGVNATEAPALAATMLGGPGMVGRAVTSPVGSGLVGAGATLASGGSLPQAIMAGLGTWGGGRIGQLVRLARTSRKYGQLLGGAGKLMSRAAKPAEEAAEAIVDIPGRTLTKASSPPFLPKGKMRLDLGPTEQTTLTGTVGTSRPPTPKPVMSSTGAAPKGRVSQPNVSVRTEAAREAMAPPAGPAAKTSSYGGPVEADLKASLARGRGRPDPFTDEVTSRIKELAREGRSRAKIAEMLRKEFGATPGQSATAMDAVLKRSRQ